jgi:hypothetical protein
MGYSARYHATSLIAVFLALAIGVVIGAALGGDTLSDTRRDLERSLTGNLEDARARADELSRELDRSSEFSERVYPVLVRGQLENGRYGLLALGSLPDGVTDEVEDALEPTGGRLVGVGVIREPIDVASLGDDLSRTRFAGLAQDTDRQSEFGVGVGRQLVIGGDLLERVRARIFSRASGNFGGLDGVIVVRAQPEGMGSLQRSTAGRMESALLEGIGTTRTETLGIETSGTESSSIGFFQANDVSSVDSIDLSSGKLAAVLVLLGAEGSFGVKSTADSLMPDLLSPRRQ